MLRSILSLNLLDVLKTMMKPLYLSILLFFSFFNSKAHNEGIRYIENKGQWDTPILYKADIGMGALFVEEKSLTYNLYNADEFQSNHFTSSKEINSIKFHAFRINFVNALQAKIESKNNYPEYYNYILGKDQSKWKGHVKAYHLIEYTNLYKNIDFHLYSQGNFLKYDVILNPNSIINDVQLNYEGVDNLKITKSGNLIIKTSVGDIVEQKPYAYQEINHIKIEVPCEFVLINNTISFKLTGSYNKSLPLIIDPVLVFSSFSGSNANNFGMTATYGYDGSLFSGGTAFSVGYPTTLGAFDPSFNGTPAGGITDGVITRYDSTGTNLIYSTYIGGVQTETVHSLIANTNNELFLYGATSSFDFPVLNNSYDTSFAGGTSVYYSSTGSNFINGTDIYISKLSPDGTTLLGSTYLGGSQNDGINSTYSNTYDSLMYNYGDLFRGEVMLDNQGNCYLTSSTKSANFPIVNGFDNTFEGNQDAIVAKFNTDLSTLYWSTFLGGSNVDAGFSIKVDSANYVYVCGGTASNDFPTTTGTINTSYLGGKADGYIVKIDTNGTQLLSSTIIGTNDYDQCYFLEIDRFGNIYTVGQTRGVFPIINAPYSNPNSSNFIMRLSSDLTTIDYSTIFGNGNINSQFSPSAFLVDRCENIYVSGWGGSILNGGTALIGMPTTSNAVFPNSPNGFDFYLIVLERDIQSLLYGTYFGGNQSQEHVDGGTSRFDKNGIVYQSVCAGCQNNDDFPTTPGAWSNTNNSSGCNNGIFKFDFEIVPKAHFSVDNYEGCAPLTVTFTNNSNSSDTYFWDFGSGDTTSQVFNPIRTYSTPGTYNVTLIIQDSICNTIDTARQVIVVNPPIIINSTSPDTVSCDSVLLTASASGASSYIWSSNSLFTDTLNPTLSDTTTVFNNQVITYYVMATNGICSDIDSVTITFHAPSQPILGLDNQQGCAPLTVNFTNQSGPHDYFLWDFGNNDTTSQTLNPIKTFASAGSYPVSLTVVDSICNTSLTSTTTITVASAVSITTPNIINTCNSALLYSNTSGATTYIWSSNPLFTDTLNPNLDDSLTVFLSDTTTYYLMATNGVCFAIDSIIVNFNGVLISTTGGAVCSGANDTLSVISLNNQTLTYSWQPVGEILSGETTANPIVNPLNTTMYYVNAQNSFGCSANDSALVVVSGFNPNNLFISADKDTLFNGEYTYLHADPDSNFSYLWTPSNSLNNSAIANPLANPTTTTTYTILFTETSSSCTYQKFYTIYAYEIVCGEPDVFLPNAFTPNDDKENDVLFLRGRNVQSLYLKIYDRWGELVFETQQQNIGWDGKYKGKPVDPAVYVYHLSVICVDGQEYFKKGNVTVIR